MTQLSKCRVWLLLGVFLTTSSTLLAAPRKPVVKCTTEVCDGIDNDCDGLVDEGLVCSTSYYCDSDHDGYISSISSGTCNTFGCMPAGCQTTKSVDCNDSNALVNPNQIEDCDSDGIDNDCDGVVDECSKVPDTTCAPLKYDGVSMTNRVNLVLVPSGFNGDMALFKSKADWIYQQFKAFQPLGADISTLNVFYAPVEKGSYCNFGCNGIDRLLCCDTALAKSISSQCTTGARQTIVVHNSTTYGGAGYTSEDVATTSLHTSAPLVAVHELGHSLFNLADEYNYVGATPSFPNCDYSGCSKWKDLLGYKGVSCLANNCGGGSYYASENTIMKALGYNFEEVNLRITCCTYLQTTGSTPLYCDQFKALSPTGDLSAFCGSGSYTGSMAAPVEYVGEPTTYGFSKVEGGGWKLESITSGSPGFYKKEHIHGSPNGKVEVALKKKGGGSHMVRVSDTTDVEFPEGYKTSAGYSQRPKKTFSIVVDNRAIGEIDDVTVNELK